MLKRLANALLVLLLTCSCVEHYEYNYLTDDLTESPQDQRTGDGFGDISPVDIVIPTDTADVGLDISDGFVSDVTDVTPQDVPDGLDALDVDDGADLVDLCGPDCTDPNPCTESSGTCDEGVCKAPLLSLEEIDDKSACWCYSDDDCLFLDANICDSVGYVCELETEGVEHSHCTLSEDVQPADCDDGIDCTVDGCDALSGCTHEAVDAACDDDNACTADTCDAVEGCQHDPVEGSCDDLNPCTLNDACQAGVCQAGADALDCADEHDCTTDTCDPETGCVNTPVDASCDDSDACTTDSCSVETGCLNTPVELVCDDGNPCTVGSCDSASGECQYEAVPGTPATPCDDGDVCTLDDGVCVDGECQATPLDCDDSNPCTDDGCGDAGCFNTPNDLACDDLDGCTEGDYCEAGTCVPGPTVPVSCLDFDHDGIANGDDSCPLAFDGLELDLDNDGKPDGCEELTSGELFRMRELNLSAQGAPSTAQRTSEIVDIALLNGRVDNANRGYFPLNGDASQPYDEHGGGGTLVNVVPTTGAFGDEGGAVHFNGLDSAIVFPVAELGQQASICIWLKSDDGDSFAFGSTSADGQGAKFSFDANDDSVSVTLQSSPNDVFTMYTELPFTGLFDLDWHHLCMQWDIDDAAARFYFDGQFMPGATMVSGSPMMDKVPLVNWQIGAYYNGSAGTSEAHFAGSADELLAGNRWLSPGEIATYFASGLPYGSSLVPGAQADFDDVRILEVPGKGTALRKRRSRVIGVRPHSDSPCPAGVLPNEWPDREDLCGVVAYWPMGGDTDSVAGNFHLLPTTDANESQLGRFGDPGGASAFYDGGAFKSQSILESDKVTDQDLTIELWFFATAHDLTGGYLLGSPTSPAATLLSVDAEGAISWNLATAMGDVAVTGQYEPGSWTHVALVYDGAHVNLYVNGLRQDQQLATGNIVGSGQPLYVGAAGESEGWTSRVILDEILVHDVAKSEDYLFHRARPELPTIRFLAGTVLENDGTNEEPLFPARNYRLGWGGPDAVISTPYISNLAGETCHGLANRCFGLLGWWDFNDPTLGLAVDLASLHLHGAINGAAGFEKGLDGTALKLVGGATGGYVEVPYVPLLQLSRFTIETLAASVDGALVSRGMGVAGEGYNYQLLLEAGSQIESFFDAQDGSVAKAEGQPGAFPPGGWATISSIFDGASLLTLVDRETDASLASEQVPALTSMPLMLGGAQTDDGTVHDRLDGTLDDMRLWNRALALDELQVYPRLAPAFGAFLDATGAPLDSDGDGILDDGDGSFVIGDHPCAWGETEDCDDNAPDDINGDQDDPDGDGIGTVIDNCPDVANPDQADHNGDGAGNLCDPVYLTDWDHDTLVGGDDACPFAFDGLNADYNGDDHPDACKPYTDGYPFGQDIWLETWGDQSRRATNEIVDMPLKSGQLDASTLLYLPLDGSYADYSPNTVMGVGIFGAESGYAWEGGPSGLGEGLSLADGACLGVPDPFVYPLREFTAMSWVRTGENAVIFDNGEILGGASQGFSLTYNLGFLELNLGNGVATCSSAYAINQWSGNDWHHIALTFKDGVAMLFIDGAHMVTKDCTDKLTDLADDGEYLTVGCSNQGYGNAANQAMDELLMFSRRLLPDEVENYFSSARPYGASLVPESQPDFDDIRIMEYPFDDEPGKEFVTRSRIIGVRPHSDSACPQNVPAGTVASRDDLCAVTGYWPLDNASGEEVTQGPGSPLYAGVGNAPAFLTFGRFGGPDGGIRFSNRSQALLVPGSEVLNPATGSVSLEFWYRVPDHSKGSVVHPLNRKSTLGVNGYQVSYTAATGQISCEWFGGSGATFVVPAATYNKDRHWHHVGCVLDREGASIVGRLYLDGLLDRELSTPSNTLGSLSTDDPLLIGWANNDNDISLELDEVLQHEVAKSSDYFFYRARPSLPHVRFMVNTSSANMGFEQAPNYPMRGYDIKWGSWDAQAMVPIVAKPGTNKVCYGLANECMGYVGWWRLDGLDEEVAFDASAYHLHGNRNGSPFWQFKNGQFGLTNNGSPGYVAIPSRPHLYQERGTMECVFSPAFFINGSSPNTMMLFNRWNANDDSYYGAINGSGQAYFTRQTTYGPVNISSTQDQWFTYATYHTAFEAGDSLNTMHVDLAEQPQKSTVKGGFGADGKVLFFGAAEAGGNAFSGTLYEYRFMARKLEPDEFLRKRPVRAFLIN